MKIPLPRLKTDADQLLLALQQLANNSNSALFNININRTSKLPKSLTTTMSTSDGKSEKFELFEDLFQTSLKIHNQLTGNNKINCFQFVMRGEALQTIKTLAAVWHNLVEVLAIFRRNYFKPQSMATAKQKFEKPFYYSSKPKVGWFSWWTSETGQRCIRNSCSHDHWTLHKCPVATTHEKNP